MPLKDKKYLDKIGKVLCVEFLDHFVTHEGAEKATIQAFGLLEDEDKEYIFLVHSRTKFSTSSIYNPYEQFKILKNNIKHITEYEIKEED